MDENIGLILFEEKEFTNDWDLKIHIVLYCMILMDTATVILGFNQQRSFGLVIYSQRTTRMPVVFTYEH